MWKQLTPQLAHSCMLCPRCRSRIRFKQSALQRCWSVASFEDDCKRERFNWREFDGAWWDDKQSRTSSRSIDHLAWRWRFWGFIWLFLIIMFSPYLCQYSKLVGQSVTKLNPTWELFYSSNGDASYDHFCHIDCTSNTRQPSVADSSRLSVLNIRFGSWRPQL